VDDITRVAASQTSPEGVNGGGLLTNCCTIKMLVLGNVANVRVFGTIIALSGNTSGSLMWNFFYLFGPNLFKSHTILYHHKNMSFDINWSRMYIQQPRPHAVKIISYSVKLNSLQKLLCHTLPKLDPTKMTIFWCAFYSRKYLNMKQICYAWAKMVELPSIDTDIWN